MKLVVQVTVDDTGNVLVEHKGLNPDQCLMALSVATGLIQRKLIAGEVMNLVQLDRASRAAGSVLHMPGRG